MVPAKLKRNLNTVQGCMQSLEMRAEAITDETPDFELNAWLETIIRAGKQHEEYVDEVLSLTTITEQEQQKIMDDLNEFEERRSNATEKIRRAVLQRESQAKALKQAADKKAAALRQLEDVKITLAAIEDIKDEVDSIHQLVKNAEQNPLAITKIDHVNRSLPDIKGHYELLFKEVMPYVEPEQQTELRTNRKEFRKVISEIEEWIFDKATKREGSTSHSSGSNDSRYSAKIKLPTIALPSFDGSPESWICFRDTFKSLVHSNGDLSGSTKFRYLKTSITDKLSPISHLPESDEGYEDAWNAVIKRYENKRRIIDKHFQSIFVMKKMSAESAEEIQRVINEARCHITALKRMHSDADLFNMIVAHQIIFRLDPHTRDLYETEKQEEIPSWTSLEGFLEKRHKVLSTLPKPAVKVDAPKTTFKPQHAKATNSFAVKKEAAKPNSKSCFLCGGEHYVRLCENFLKLNVQERKKVIDRSNLCHLCFAPGHKSENCQSQYKCKKCSQKHNILLHEEQTMAAMTRWLDSTQPLPDEFVPQIASSSTALSNHGSSHADSVVYLSTAIINVLDVQGNWHPIRALLDGGSQPNVISKSIAEALGLPMKKTSIRVNGIGDVSIDVSKSIVTSIASSNGEAQHTLEFLISSKPLTGLIPSSPIDKKDLKIPLLMVMADPHFAEPRKIDALIGNEIFLKLLKARRIELPNGPILQDTHFGWILGGRISSPNVTKIVTSHHLSTQNDLKQAIEKFYQEEDYRTPKRFLTEEEKYCETVFEQTHKRDENGRFVITIPLKENASQLANNRNQAYHQFIANEKRLLKNDQLRQQYEDFMGEYEDLGHMEIVEAPTHGPAYYLPHHAVENPGSTTTKLRVVFNASSKTSSGLSFNDVQCIGPQVQTESFPLTLNFRMKNIVIKADIAKMYRQIEVTPDQRSLQLILWRKNIAEQVKTFALKTVTYGTASASYQATRCLKQLAIDNKEMFPIASQVIEENFYVDDLVFGAKTVEGATQTFKEVDGIVSSAQMKLRKVSSNSREFMQSIPSDDEDKLENGIVKTLGVKWDTKADEIGFNVTAMDTTQVTKRRVLSEISKIFDPVGLLGPATFLFKCFLREVSQLKVNWDQDIQDDFRERWTEMANSVIELNKMKVPRAAVLSNYVTLQVHGFSDASKLGIGACIYLRSEDAMGNRAVRLLCAKSRLAPTQTIPRLELSGLVILANLMSQVEETIKVPVQAKFAHCDSAIAIFWTRKPPSSLQPYVANRVAEIQKLMKTVTIRHVRTESNPADMISRGLAPSELIVSPMWTQGPHFLLEDEENWPQSMVTIDPEDVTYKSELKKICFNFVINTEENQLFKSVESSSTIREASRRLALAIRFIQNCKASKNATQRSIGYIGAVDVNHARMAIIRMYQSIHFAAEIRQLRKGELTSKESKLQNLDPFWDEEDRLIRVGGRLRNAEQLNCNNRHQILIPRSHLSRLLIREAHRDNLHCGQLATQGHIMTRYWMMNAKSTIRQEIHQCIRCFRAKPKMIKQFMGQLPKARVTPSSPFANTGVDYAGPIQMKVGSSRTQRLQKAYVAVFVCLATKAIHLELVTDMTTKAFIATLDRFVSRRGLPQNIYSDNAKNFVGASNQLKEFKLFLNEGETQEKISRSLTDRGISWHFIPPRAPEHGGLWEAGVKSMKHHLVRVTNQANFTYEELSTILCKIEASLNSRPITSLSNDPNDLKPLTPAHFLIGQPLNALPQHNLVELQTNRLERWDRVNQVQQQFWSRWHRDYLHQLQARQKNFKQKIKLKVGQLVLISSEAEHPMKWPLARIHRLIPGKDDIVRVVELKTSKGLLNRPVTKLAILPMEEDKNYVAAAEYVGFPSNSPN